MCAFTSRPRRLSLPAVPPSLALSFSLAVMAAFLSRFFGEAPPALPPPVAFTEVLPALVAASFAGSALGFVRPVWFISVGE